MYNLYDVIFYVAQDLLQINESRKNFTQMVCIIENIHIFNMYILNIHIAGGGSACYIFKATVKRNGCCELL